jgi:hypothetical protein
VIGGKSNSRLDIDVSGLPDNMEPTWIRETIAGAPDDDNMDLALGRNGYVPVTTDMLPQLKIPTLPGKSEDATKLIRQGGLILMMRPRELSREARAQQVEDNEAAINSATRIPQLSTGAKGSDGDGFIEHRSVSERVNKGAAKSGRFEE